ncbi:isoprenylcysteine carboxylmethyltransferase family protein [Aerosakkonemataceae cyanobacterium BLCC-F154]|uniref:Isoprenylcysteine carboxylmethyltransferase family protein n=1 Tax=Floridaenema fluviatile BLCC-F154 TaxID=3153640 RepID=A0ABV4Y9C9_9CYAN
MSNLDSAIKLLFVVFVFLAILIALPAVVFGVIQKWQVIFLLCGYLLFFSGNVWRVWRYGKLSKTQEDAQFKESAGLVILAGQFIAFLAIHWWAIYNFSRLSKTETFLQVIGMIIVVLAIIINQLAIRTLKGLFDRITIKPNHQLITTGIYRQVRHPVYLSYVLLLIGYCTILQSFVSLVLTVVSCTIWLGNRINIEEKMLVEKFGDRYQAYQRKTKKIIPFIY